MYLYIYIYMYRSIKIYLFCLFLYLHLYQHIGPTFGYWSPRAFFKMRPSGPFGLQLRGGVQVHVRGEERLRESKNPKNLYADTCIHGYVKIYAHVICVWASGFWKLPNQERVEQERCQGGHDRLPVCTPHPF